MNDPKLIVLYEALALVLTPLAIVGIWLLMFIAGTAAPLAGIPIFISMYIFLKQTDSRYYVQDFIPTKVMTIRLGVIALIFGVTATIFNPIYFILNFNLVSKIVPGMQLVTTIRSYLGLFFLLAILRSSEYVLVIVSRIFTYGFQMAFAI